MRKQLNISTILQYSTLGLATLLLLSSCFVAKKYERPEDVTPADDLFRKEYQQVDSTNIGLVQWESFYTDTILQRHLRTALAQNYDFNIAYQNIISTNAYYLQASQAFLPSLTIAPGASYTTQSLNTQFGQLIGQRRHIYQYDLTGSLSWEADIWGKLTSAKRASMADFEKSIAARQALQTTLISNVASLYYQLLTLDAQKAITTATIQMRKQSLETTLALKDAGTLTEVAVQQNEAMIYNAEALLISLDNQIKIIENTLSQLIGQSPQPIDRSTLANQAITTELSVGVPYQLLSNRPDVRAAEYNLMSAFQMVNVAKANFYPSLRLTANSGFQSIDIDDIFSPRAIFANVITSLTQPIWNRRQIKTQHEVSLANQQIAYLNYKKTILNAGKEVSDALINIAAQQDIEALKMKEYEAYQKATEYSEELMNYGLANYLEVLRAQENELNTQLSILNAQYNKLNATVQLYKALGGGWQ